MRRKIVKHGPSSLTISLPMAWAKKNNLKNGDEIEVIEKDTELLVTGHGKAEQREINITLTGKKRFVHRLFNMPYLLGYDVINVNFDSYSIMESIQNCIQVWRSFEIVEQRENFCKLRSIAEARPEELDSMILRMFNICATIFDEILKFVRDKDEEALKRVALLDYNMTGIDLFCRRLINTGKFMEARKLGSSYAIVRALEGMSDVARDIAKENPKIRTENRKELVSIIELLIKSFNLLRHIRYKKETEPIYEYKDIKNKLRGMFDKENNFNKGEMFLSMSLRHLIFSLHDLSEEVLLWVDVK